MSDAALLLEAIAGHDPADPGSVPARTSHFTNDLARGIEGLRIGYVRHFHTGGHPGDQQAHPEVAAALETVAATLTSQGAQLREITLPSLADFNVTNRIILAAESWAIHAPWLRTRPGDYGQVTRRRLLTGAFLSAGDYIQAQRRRTALIAAVDEAFKDVDILLTASSLDPAAAIEDWPEVERTYSRQARMPFNVTGHPAIAMMSGLSTAGLPPLRPIRRPRLCRRPPPPRRRRLRTRNPLDRPTPPHGRLTPPHPAILPPSLQGRTVTYAARPSKPPNKHKLRPRKQRAQRNKNPAHSPPTPQAPSFSVPYFSVL